MRLASSDYMGEPVWDEPTETTPFLQNILVDVFTDKHVDAELTPDAVQDLTPTEFCQLEPAEDSFLELGQSSNSIPELVSNWNPRDVLSNSRISDDQASSKSTLQLLTVKNSVAWFELVVLERSNKSVKGVNSAIAFDLQIEVGNGSWESSLVQPELNADSADAKDMVSFSLVIVWDNKR